MKVLKKSVRLGLLVTTTMVLFVLNTSVHAFAAARQPDVISVLPNPKIAPDMSNLVHEVHASLALRRPAGTLAISHVNEAAQLASSLVMPGGWPRSVDLGRWGVITVEPGIVNPSTLLNERSTFQFAFIRPGEISMYSPRSGKTGCECIQRFVRLRDQGLEHLWGPHLVDFMEDFPAGITAIEIFERRVARAPSHWCRDQAIYSAEVAAALDLISGRWAEAYGM
jgi:hypothetical protein